MRRPRTILTLTLVAAVLCADRVVTAAAEAPPQVVETARLVGRRLTAGMRRGAVAVRLERGGAVGVVAAMRPTAPGEVLAPSGGIQLPGQLPMPPPAI